MATASFTVRYRPLRVGFVVQRGDLTALAEVAKTNSLLWGGIYNPILVAGEDARLLAQLLELFSVDLLTPIGESPEAKAVMDAFPYLRTPHHFADGIFFEDWETKRLDVGMLDVIHIVDHYWETDFRHKASDFKSNCLVVDWANEDPCASVLALSFGALPAGIEKLKYDFRKVFERGLLAETASLSASNPLPASLGEKITPLRLTQDRLQQWGGSLREDDGIFIGHSMDFEDLVAFWNLRAAGTRLQYLPHDHLDRFHDYTQAWLEHLDAIPARPPLDRAWTGIHWRENPALDVPALLARFAMQKRPLLCRYDPVVWNGLNVRPSSFSFDTHSVLANVDRPYERYTVSFALPTKPVSENMSRRGVGFQHLAAIVSPLVEFEYPGHTLKPPPLRALDEFLSREIAFDPWKVHTDPEGLALTIQVHDSSENLYPVPHHDLILKLLETVGIQAEMSAAGILADRIVKQMREARPLDDLCRVFKIPGVRKLLKDLTATETISWTDALRTIGKERFGPFKSLYIESRKTPKLTPVDVLVFLIKKEILRPRLRFWPRILRYTREVRCAHCGLTSRVALRAFEGTWRCSYCKHEEDLAVRIATDFRGDRREWALARSGLFAKDNHQEGAIPVILTLLQMLRVLDMQYFMYAPSMHLRFAGGRCETDLVVLSHGRRGQIELGIGECKDERGVIDEQDVTNLRRAWERFEDSKIACHLVFAKTADAFSPDELQRFRTLQNDRIPVVLLTNRDLEGHGPSEAGPGLPRRYAGSLSDMAHNSSALYLMGEAGGA